MAGKLSYRIDEAVEATGLSRPTIYRLIERGELTTFKVERTELIRAPVLDDLKERLRRGRIDLSEPPIEQPPPPLPLCGVYLLYVGDELAYVGRSTSIRARLTSHRSAGRSYDRCEVIACDEGVSVWLEKELIRTLRPKQNLLRYARHTKAAKRRLAEMADG